MTEPLTRSEVGWHVSRKPGSDMYEFTLVNTIRDRPLVFAVTAVELRALLDAASDTIERDRVVWERLAFADRR